MSLRKGDIQNYDKLNRFLEIMDMEWSIKISANALATFETRKMNTVELLPLTEDLKFRICYMILLCYVTTQTNTEEVKHEHLRVNLSPKGIALLRPPPYSPSHPGFKKYKRNISLPDNVKDIEMEDEPLRVRRSPRRFTPSTPPSRPPQKPSHKKHKRDVLPENIEIKDEQLGNGRSLTSAGDVEMEDEFLRVRRSPRRFTPSTPPSRPPQKPSHKKHKRDVLPENIEIKDEQLGNGRSLTGAGDVEMEDEFLRVRRSPRRPTPVTLRPPQKPSHKKHKRDALPENIEIKDEQLGDGRSLTSAGDVEMKDEFLRVRRSPRRFTPSTPPSRPPQKPSHKKHKRDVLPENIEIKNEQSRNGRSPTGAGDIEMEDEPLRVRRSPRRPTPVTLRPPQKPSHKKHKRDALPENIEIIHEQSKENIQNMEIEDDHSRERRSPKGIGRPKPPPTRPTSRPGFKKHKRDISLTENIKYVEIENDPLRVRRSPRRPKPTRSPQRPSSKKHKRDILQIENIQNMENADDHSRERRSSKGIGRPKPPPTRPTSRPGFKKHKRDISLTENIEDVEIENKPLRVRRSPRRPKPTRPPQRPSSKKHKRDILQTENIENIEIDNDHSRERRSPKGASRPKQPPPAPPISRPGSKKYRRDIPLTENIEDVEIQDGSLRVRRSPRRPKPTRPPQRPSSKKYKRDVVLKENIKNMEIKDYHSRERRSPKGASHPKPPPTSPTSRPGSKKHKRSIPLEKA
ncbi:unnamed protein product [Psylliodes chrysocephalus]|uniref:Uncharacterized protein n=1 Tax=Psylliodes chrysocephalus TaxID=3402493 RepID=A0A9P0D3Y4_9CUCU|nr:unnamed protein product [Psylliodes chrysocephala]